MTTATPYTLDTNLEAVEWPMDWGRGDGGVIQVCHNYGMYTLGGLHDWLQRPGNRHVFTQECRKPAIANFAINLAEKTVNAGAGESEFNKDPGKPPEKPAPTFPRIAPRREPEEDPDDELEEEEAEPPTEDEADDCPQLDIPESAKGRVRSRLERMNKFLRAFYETGDVQKAGAEAGVPSGTYHPWRRNYPDFKRAVDALTPSVRRATNHEPRTTTPPPPVVDEPDTDPEKAPTPTQDAGEGVQQSTVDCQPSTEPPGEPRSGDDGYGQAAFPPDAETRLEDLESVVAGRADRLGKLESAAETAQDRLDDLVRSMAHLTTRMNEFARDVGPDRMAKLEDVVKDIDNRLARMERAAVRAGDDDKDAGERLDKLEAAVREMGRRLTSRRQFKHPLIEGLIEALPQPGTSFSDDDRVQWFETAASVFNLLYTDQGDDDE